MCNCISDVQERFKSKITEVPAYSNLKIKSVSLDNVAIMFSGGTQAAGSVTITHEPVGRKTKTTVNVCYRYCPFCGEKYEKEDSDV